MAENAKALDNPRMSRMKLILKDYTAFLIDIILSIIVSLIPVITLKVVLKEMFQKYFPPSELPFYNQFNYQVLTAFILITGFIIFKILRSLKNGSPGEKMMSLD